MKNNNYPSWLVPLEIAKELKEIGFKEKCLCYWHEYFHRIECSTDDEDRLCPEYYDYNTDESTTSLPTWEQIFEWFREKKIYGNVNQEWEYGRYNSPIGLNYFYVINDCRKKKINKTKAIVNGGFDNYEEAREELVIKIIRIYKNEQL